MATDKEKKEHCGRVQRNESSMKDLGLTCERETGQVYKLIIKKEDLVVWNEWCALGRQESVIMLHWKLEIFLQEYKKTAHF